ncbi:VOC family protein [uncultured Flavobacterium sp.]|uniref:VOC family protein n=1 Tax=uncultured Flavobacterium sp. TaxID=165435 RepID=UPI0025FB67F3|nr:VOC family protein [uncultured Flavobacterium sp.]
MAIEMVNWLEIPVNDMARARKFYEEAFDTKLVDMNVDGQNYPCFPNKKDDGFSGALVQYDFTPLGSKGPLVYLASDDVVASVERVKAAGGEIVKGREEIAPGFGYFALFEDTEGNLLALQGDK